MSSSVTLSAATTTVTPGMMVTGTGVTAGTYVTAVNGANISLSTPSSIGSAVTLTFTPAIVVNSSIQDYDTGGSYFTALNKSGAGILTLTNANTYSGVTTVADQGTLNLASLGTGSLRRSLGVATNVVIPGDLIINGGVTGTGTIVNELLNSGQIAATSNVTIKWIRHLEPGGRQHSRQPERQQQWRPEQSRLIAIIHRRPDLVLEQSHHGDFEQCGCDPNY